MTERTVAHIERTFGGTRIAGGMTTVNMWSDAVVIAHAVTFDPESPIAGTVFTFRGTITKTGHGGRDTWAVRREDGGLMDTYRTRQDAVLGAEAIVVMDAFRALNAIEALAKIAASPKHDYPTCECGPDIRVLPEPPKHTVGGKADGPWPYGTTHDMDCPGCAGTSFTASPRSETYWSS
jgi:hypothetical protein